MSNKKLKPIEERTEPEDWPLIELENGFVFDGTHEELAIEIMKPDSESDLNRLNNLMEGVWDIVLEKEQSKQFGRWLIKFAEKYSVNDYKENDAAIAAAVHIGVTSFIPPEIGNLFDGLLESKCHIRTNLNTVKQIGRIFQAHPPKCVNEYPDLANKIFKLSEHVINEVAIASPQKSPDACVASLCIRTLITMGSSRGIERVETVKQINETWFIEYLHRGLCRIRDAWAANILPNTKKKCHVVIAPDHLKLFNEAIEILIPEEEFHPLSSEEKND